MGRTVSWWLVVGIFFSLALTFMYAMMVGRNFQDLVLPAAGAGVALALLLSLTSR